MIFHVFILLFGLMLLVKGADWLIDGATALAKQYNISDLAIGLTVVGFGTSVPELLVNIFASIDDHQNFVIGNIIGSNIFNLLFILGLTGLIAPVVVQSSTVWKEIPISFLAIVLLFVIANNNLSDSLIISRAEGFAFIAFFCLFLYYVFRQLKNDIEAPKVQYKKISVRKMWAHIIVGLILLVIGGNLLVTNAVEIAIALGVSEKIVGLTIIAAGTSLPELATSLSAVLKKNNDVAVGNVIGSNIFNIFFVLGTSAMIRPISYNPVFNIDLYVLSAGTIFLFIAMFSGKKKKLDRWEAFILLAAYFVYILYLIGKEV
jgi:cation:H+ antiporter